MPGLPCSNCRKARNKVLADPECPDCTALNPPTVKRSDPLAPHKLPRSVLLSLFSSENEALDEARLELTLEEFSDLTDYLNKVLSSLFENPDKSKYLSIDTSLSDCYLSEINSFGACAFFAFIGYDYVTPKNHAMLTLCEMPERDSIIQLQQVVQRKKALKNKGILTESLVRDTIHRKRGSLENNVRMHTFGVRAPQAPVRQVAAAAPSDMRQGAVVCARGEHCESYSCAAMHPPLRRALCPSSGFDPLPTQCLDSKCRMLHRSGLGPTKGLHIKSNPCKHGNSCCSFHCVFSHPAGRLDTCWDASCTDVCNKVHDIKGIHLHRFKHRGGAAASASSAAFAASAAFTASRGVEGVPDETDQPPVATAVNIGSDPALLAHSYTLIELTALVAELEARSAESGYLTLKGAIVPSSGVPARHGKIIPGRRPFTAVDSVAVYLRFGHFMLPFFVSASCTFGDLLSYAQAISFLPPGVRRADISMAQQKTREPFFCGCDAHAADAPPRGHRPQLHGHLTARHRGLHGDYEPPWRDATSRRDGQLGCRRRSGARRPLPTVRC